MDIVIRTQKELDALPSNFDVYTNIYIENDPTIGRIIIAKHRENSYVVARENASVVARRNTSVVATGNASVMARENASVEARENASVEAWENASVMARENASVVAWGNASVEAWGNSSVEARENSSVEAWENSSVEARENSSVEAWENASVEAWENSSVVAWENSSVEAWGNVGVHLQSDNANVVLFMFAVCWALAKGKVTSKSKTATIIRVQSRNGVVGWLDNNGVEIKNDSVVLYKRVSADLKTQEGTTNETVWEVGKTLDHPSWSPKEAECGPGKFHACSRTYFCDEFRSFKTDKYVAIEINVEDLYAWDNGSYPHKIAFKKGKVLYVCDKRGNQAKE